MSGLNPVAFNLLKMILLKSGDKEKRPEAVKT
jgi:hypothetical protein